MEYGKDDKYRNYIPLKSVLTDEEYSELMEETKEPGAEIIVLADWKSARGL